jgi:hypothetical protein
MLHRKATRSEDYLLPDLLSYLLTPWRRVILEKLIGSQLVKKFPEFYGTRRFITTFTRARKEEGCLLKWPVLMKI